MLLKQLYVLSLQQLHTLIPTFSLLTIQLPAAGASPPETGAAAATAAPPAGTDANFS